MSEVNAKKEVSIQRGLLTTLVLVVISVIIVFATRALGLASWVAFLGLTIWGVLGSPVTTFSEVVSRWLSTALGLTIAYLIESREVLGTAGFVIGLAATVALIFCLVTGRFKYICNPYCTIFLVVSVAIHLEALPIALSVLFGFITVGVIPFVIIKLINKK